MRIERRDELESGESSIMRSHTTRLAAIGFAAATTTLITTGLATAGGVPTWVGGVGDWNDPANWSTGAVPPLGSSVFINNGGTAIATGLDLEVGPSIIGGFAGSATGDGGLEIRGGSLAVGGFFSLAVGSVAGTTGTFTATDGAMIDSTIPLYIGRQGTAIARIDGGSDLTTNRLYVAGQFRTSDRATTADATLDIAGPDTVVRANTIDSIFEGFSIGLEGRADVTVRDGALVETTNLLFVTSTPADSSLTIEGADTVFRVASTGLSEFGFGRDVALDPVVSTGDAIVTLRDAATIDARNTTGGVLVSEQGVLRGSGHILGDAVNRLGLIDPGEGGAFGHLTISGTLDNTGDNDFINVGGTLRFDIGGVAIGQYDQLTVGSLIRGGILEVVLDPGYDAALGDTFELITITDAQTFPEPNAFEQIVLPGLGGPLFFETTIDDTGVTLTVAPAPGSLALMGVVGLAATRRRRELGRGTSRRPVGGRQSSSEMDLGPWSPAVRSM